ncbi:putative MFS family arabinose efflux permease [Luteibacter rhizovicinus]|uniref:Putative MFS family arabinose efflux permease n=2 Tax=Luteibacter rhizovicinus TaxID=242606 RepID=A0A4R3YM88_9GAMM|nr:putative MFS family arabinose efflux permease [Luteibacter rhizovicinus]
MIPMRYRALTIYAALQALMQFEWLRFAPITTEIASQYGVSPSAIGNLSLVFPLLFIPLALPAGLLLDRVPVRTSLRISAVGMALAALLRILGPSYGFLLAGQVMFSVLQPLVMALVARLAAVWFAEDERLRATEISSMAIFAGLGLAFVLVPVIGFRTLWLDVAVLGALAVSTLLWVPADPREAAATPGPRPSWRSGMLAMLRAPAFLVVTAYFFLANGYFNAISTWLESILHRHGIDPQTAGIVALCMLISGIVCMALIERVSSWLSLRMLMLIAALGSIGVTVVLFTSSSPVVLGLAGILLGATLLAPLPLLIQVVAKSAGEEHAGTAASLFFLMGNAGAAAFIAAFEPIADAGQWTLGCCLLIAMLVVQGVLAAIGGPRQRWPA